MSKTAISQYSATPSSNSDVDGIDISEGCPASNLNNAQRSLMSHLKEMDDGTSALTSPSMGQLNVDNLRLDGNTISSTDTNGDITIDPDGTGDTIIASGNVGIGTSSPSETLHVEESTTGNAVRVSKGGNYIVMGGSGSGTQYVKGYEGTIAFGNAFAGNTTFLTGDTERMRIDSSGNVGIGTSSPAQLMHVNNSSGDAAVQIQGNTRSFKIEQNNYGLRIADVSAGNANRMQIDAAGMFGFGTDPSDNTPTNGCQFDVNDNGFYATMGHTTAAGTGYGYLRFAYNGGIIGQIAQSGTTGISYGTSSDYRLKENVTYDWDATTRLKQLKPARFNFIADADTTVDGFLAHEAQTVVPEAVTGTKDAMRDEEYEITPAVLDDNGNEVTPAEMGTRSVPDYQGIDQSKLVPLLVKTIQELEARITALEAE